LPIDEVNGVALDTNGHLWVACENVGVAKFDGTLWYNYNELNSPYGDIDEVFIDDAGVTWGSRNWTLIRKNPTGTAWKIFTSLDGFLPGTVTAITEDKKGNLWVGVYEEGISKFDGVQFTNFETGTSSLPSDKVKSLGVDHFNRIWCGAKGVSYYDGYQWNAIPTPVSSWIVSTAVDTSNNIWFATRDGLLKYDGLIWTQYTPQNSNIPNDQIKSVVIDENNSIWMASDGGVTVFDGASTWLTYDDTNSPLPTKYCTHIAIGADGAKWISSADGIMKFEDGGPGPYTFSLQSNITGRIFLDLDTNGIKDTNEVYYANHLAQLQPFGTFATSSGTGLYDFAVSAGTYTIDYFGTKPWFYGTTTPSSVTVTNNSSIDSVDLGFYILDSVTDVKISLSSLNPRCIGHSKIFIDYKNDGSLVSNGTIRLTLDSLATFASSNYTPDNILGNVIEWTYSGLGFQESEQIVVQILGVPFPGNIIAHTVEIIPVNTDSLPSDNVDTTSDMVLCSFDPNDKKVLPRGFGEIGAIGEDDLELTYTIRFQNTGSDTAYNITILDTIAMALEFATFRLEASSHPVNYSINDQRLISFQFFGIKLPDSTTNEAESHGFVKFSIRRDSTLPHLTTISNKSAIYFDFNDPVITNSTLNTVCLLNPFASFSFTQDGQFLNFQDNSQNTGTYLWEFGDGDTSSAPEPDHEYKSIGEFYVTLTIENDCGRSVVQSIITVDELIASIPAEETQVLIFPNPNSGSFTISVGGSIAGPLTIDIYDIHGSLVHHDIIRGKTDDYQKSFSHMQWPPGIYLARIKSGEFAMTRKLVLTIK